MRLVNLPILKESWKLAFRHLAVLGPAFILFGLINDAILSLNGTSHAQQAQLWEQLARGDGGLESLATIDASIGSAQNPGGGLLAIGLMLLATSIELVIALGLIWAKHTGQPVTLASQLAFLKQGTYGSLKGITRGLLRFILFSIALSMAIIVMVLTLGSGSPSPFILPAVGAAIIAILVWMMVFLQPYIYATVDCIMHPARTFHDAFLRCDAAMQGRRIEMVITLLLCVLPALFANLPFAVLPLGAATPVALILGGLLSVPSAVMLYLYYRDLESRFSA